MAQTEKKQTWFYPTDVCFFSVCAIGFPDVRLSNILVSNLRLSVTEVF